MTPDSELHVEASRCIRCGACATLAPGVFDVGGSSSRVLRPAAAAERVFVEAARWICPTDAIRGAPDDDASRAPVETSDARLFHDLATSAERVRWSLSELKLDDIDRTLAPPELRSVVREMAFSENATYSATQRFLDAFFDDVDFSQWISVWFYEETRHPHVLTEWLRRVGDPVTADFVVKGRVSTPLMRSIFGTLVTNLISEVTAAQAYRRLAARSPEPILGGIARLIAGDEARHAATFFRFARRYIAAAPRESNWRERARGLEVLRAWLGGVERATHPVAQMVERLNEAGNDQGALDLDFTSVHKRVVRVVGLLLALPLRREDEVAPMLKELLSERRES